MASHWFHSRQVFLAGILLATEIILGLPGSAAMAMTLTSRAFKQDGQIPSKYTCEGDDISPPLAWNGVPEGTKSLVLIIDDPDAPDPKAPKLVWVHWVVYNIPPDVKASRKRKQSRPATRHRSRAKRLQKDWIRRAVPADRSAPLLPQTVCAGHHARSKEGDQTPNRASDQRPCVRGCRTHRHISKG